MGTHLCGCRTFIESDEAESARSGGRVVHDDLYTLHTAVALEDLTEITFCSIHAHSEDAKGVAWFRIVSAVAMTASEAVAVTVIASVTISITVITVVASVISGSSVIIPVAAISAVVVSTVSDRAERLMYY